MNLRVFLMCFISLYFFNSCQEEIETMNVNPYNPSPRNELFKCGTDIISGNEKSMEYIAKDFQFNPSNKAEIKIHINIIEERILMPNYLNSLKASRLIRRLNQNFAATNLNNKIIPHVFKSVAADNSNIKFIFNPSTDLTIKKTTIKFSGDEVKKENSGGIAATNPTKKLNIWIFKNKGLSYAYFPDKTNIPVLDGVVLDKIYFDTNFIDLIGGLGDAADILTHEVGHWLGLLHTFGNDCAIGDKVSDTPPQSIPSYNVPLRLIAGPLFPAYSQCNGVKYRHMTVNFMDYSIWLRMFTKGQLDRMWYFLSPPSSPNKATRYHYVIK